MFYVVAKLIIGCHYYDYCGDTILSVSTHPLNSPSSPSLPVCLDRFVPDKGFSGADQAQVRDGPVQFEKDMEEDPFGLNKFLTEAKKAKRPSEDSRDSGANKPKRPRY